MSASRVAGCFPGSEPRSVPGAARRPPGRSRVVTSARAAAWRSPRHARRSRTTPRCGSSSPRGRNAACAGWRTTRRTSWSRPFPAPTRLSSPSSRPIPTGRCDAATIRPSDWRALSARGGSSPSRRCSAAHAPPRLSGASRCSTGGGTSRAPSRRSRAWRRARRSSTTSTRAVRRSRPRPRSSGGPEHDASRS